ncbi:MAG: trypsin-like peptidase domain-containing protein [Elusimicrobia bacterium]|nr:trypsin-like peptidase domain-containing protein [Elusimicrobiota bacterium]
MIHALLTLFLAAPSARAASDEALRRATVQIQFVSRDPDWGQPWQYGPQQAGSGSGVVLPGHRILTNAHVVSDATYLTVRKAGGVRNYTAHVQFVANDGETAILTVDDPSFFDGLKPVTFGKMPYPGDHLSVYGFPTGGTDLSVTEGVVSRVGVVVYAHSGRKLLAVQTDAAINPGNSGGPVFKDGKLVGIAFQHLQGSGTENIGYVVPIPMIERFLKDVSDGHYGGIPAIGIVWQETENPALRAAYGLKDDDSGVLINKIEYGSSAWGVLRPGDVLVRLAGETIGQNGTVPLRGDERVDFGNLVSMRQIGDRVPVEVVRDGKLVKLELTLKPLVDLVPGPQYDVRPSYCVIGGMVFMPLSDDFLRAHGGGTFRLRSISDNDVVTKDRSQVVVLAQVLADEVNRGYHRWGLAAIRKLNGREIGSMKELVAAAAHPIDGRDVFEFDGGSRAVLDAAAAEKAMPRILERYGVSSALSPDLR